VSSAAGRQLVQGNEACALGAIAAGARFFAGYPITPSSEVAEVCAHKLPEYNGIYIQMEDELASMAAIVGASLSGMKSFTATSGPGFSLMQENLGVAIAQEVPCVIINVQRMGPSTGLATKPAQGDVMQARYGTHGDHAIIALSPASVEECYTLTIEAFNLAEKYRTPVILLSDEVVGHMTETFDIPSLDTLEIINRKTPQGDPEQFLPYAHAEDGIPPMAKYGDKYIMRATSSAHDESGRSNSDPANNDKLVRRLYDKICTNLEDIVRTEIFGPVDADYTIIAYGGVSRAAMQTVTDANAAGVKVNLLRLITIWPFAEKEVKDVLSRTKGVIVPELNMGQILLEVERMNVGFNTPIHPISRLDGKLITPSQILDVIKEVAK